jgi:acyl transferase domain-containing protein/NAD(P)-dependent dehydrogenase (short-subunit alcohol dehydrogenase family)/3-hydroxymyristoyl/3-hydroxydecanoyl-(acyl carrier protein) dehydratase/acyl carrier protein
MPDIRAGETAIAIIGLGALYPRSRNVREFWDNIVNGVDCVEDVPDTHWSVADYYDEDPATPDKTYAKRGGFMPTVPFDPMEFGLPPKVVEFTDVLQLLSLVVAKQALTDAGCLDSDWYDSSRTGVILGVTGANSIVQPLSARLQTPVLKEVVRSCGLSEADAEEIAERFRKAYVPWEENSFPGLLGNVVAGRIANRFDLGGINCTVDAACASSLAAVRMAVAELVSGRADLMISGGCDAQNSILMYLCFSKTPAFSKTGQIRPFDESGDGTLIGEGIGMVAMKRLADAERDGDRIYAVLRGIGASSDGRAKSIYAPREDGQVVALRRAYEDAGFGPDQIGLLEAHGTGTLVGDLTEVTALKTVYAEVAANSVALGSVKSQIGHTKGAAGAAGLIKLALGLHHKVLPPTINVDQPRAALGLQDSPFYVNTSTMPWVTDPRRPVRRAALSSFGFGGTNFHCVLEEHDSAAGHSGAQVTVWCAEHPAALLTALDRKPTGTGPAVEGRSRLAIVSADDAELSTLVANAKARLAAELDVEVFELAEQVFYRANAVPAGKVGVLFAGQGSQYVGMGAATAVALPEVRAAFDAAAAGFADEEPLAGVVFPPPAFDADTRAAQEESLRRTDYAQPAIGALAAGQYRWLRSLGFAPEGALGHSFGELTALWAAGSVTDAEYFRLARVRGQAMARRPDDRPDAGTMAVVHAGPAWVAELLTGHPDVVLCNLNAPEQVVVGGGTEPVRVFLARCQAQGVRAQLLPVAAAFHTRHVAHAAAEFGSALSEVDFRTPAFPVYANTAEAEYGADPTANRAVLVEQLTRPVSFAPRLRQLYDEGFRIFVELGPKSVLGGLATRTLHEHGDVTVLSADPGPGRDGDQAMKRLVARLVVLGLPLAEVTNPDRATDARPLRKGLTIHMNGANHVPEERRHEYQQALACEYTVTGVPTVAAKPATGCLATDHLTLHRDYLASQLRVAEDITAVLREEARNGMRDQVVAGIAAIVRQSEVIGHSHAEMLRGFPHPGQARRSEPPPMALFGATPNYPVIEASATVPAEPVVLTEALSDTSYLNTYQETDVVVSAPSSPAIARVDVVLVRAELLEIVSAKTGYPVEMLEGGMEIEADLGIDSIKRIEIMGALRDRFPSSAMVSTEALGELRSLDQIVDFVTGSEVTADPKADGGFGIARRHARLNPLPPADRLDGAFRQQPVALLAGEPSGLSDAVAAALTANGWTVHRGLTDKVAQLDLVLYLAATPTDWTAGSAELASALMLAGRTQPLLEAVERGRAAFVTVTRLDGAGGLAGADVASAPLSGMTGLVKTLAVEAPALFCRTVDLHPHLDERSCVELVLAELHDPATARTDVGYDAAGHRQGVGLSDTRDDGLPAGFDGTAIGPNDLLVVTGGARGITAACVVELARRHRPGLVLLGRTELTDEPDWAEGVPAERLRAAIVAWLHEPGSIPAPRDVEAAYRRIVGLREIAETLRAVRDADAEVHYVAVDVTDAAAIETALAPYRDRITGLVHGAGVLVDQLVVDKRREDVDRVLATKLAGLESMLAAVDQDRLRHVLLFASVAGFFGNRGQADYAMANQALNGIAAALKLARPAARVSSLNWGAWSGGMVTPELERMFADRGVSTIPLSVGAGLFVEQFDREHGHDVVCVLGPTTPLAGPIDRAVSDTAVRRSLAAIAADPVLTDHRVSGMPVLPATAAIGAMLNTVEQTRPGQRVARVQDFAVLKGVVFDDDQPSALVMELVDQSPDTVLVTVRDNAGRPRYRAVVELGDPVPARRVEPFAEGEPLDPYGTGALFHGPSLRGINRVFADGEHGLVVRCGLADVPLAGGAYATADFSPVLADLLLQAPLVWVHRHLGRQALPSRIGGLVVHRPLPDDAPFAVAVADIERTSAGVRCSVTASDSSGQVLVEITDVEFVAGDSPAEPAGVTVEYDVPDDSSHALPLLMRQLGIDQPLGYSTIFHSGLPRAGETVRCQLGGPPFSVRAWRGATLFLELFDGRAVDGEFAPPTTEKRLAKSWFTPLARTDRSRLSRADLDLLAAGDLASVFGVEWDQRADGCNSSVRLPAGDLLMLDEVEVDRLGGATGLGRLTATRRLAPDSADDPVLLAEGAGHLLQMYAMYLGLHLVLPDCEFQPALRQRTDHVVHGRITLGEIRYVTDITGISLLPRPTILADVTVYDGDTPVLSIRNLGVQVREKPGTACEVGPGGRPERFLGRRGHTGEPALLNELHLAHLAQGDVRVAMGPEFAIYQGRRAPRLPNLDFQFVDRIMSVDGARGMRGGARVVTEYDSSPEAWYYADDASAGLPSCVLMETALQSVLVSSYHLGGSLIAPDEDLVIRNLDGVIGLLADVDPRGRTIRHETELLSTQEVVGAILQRFRYRLSLDGEVFCRGESLAGYFTDRALANQSGLDGGRRVPTWLDSAAEHHPVERIDVAGARHWFDPSARLRLAGDRLDLVDHVYLVRDGGSHGAGYLVGRVRIRKDDWYFPFHFHGDPVMPGSLVLAAVVQALRVHVLHTRLADGMESPVFRTAVGVPMASRYRGQFLPTDTELEFEVHVKEVRRERGRLVVVADANVWKAGLRVDELTNVALAVTEEETR